MKLLLVTLTLAAAVTGCATPFTDLDYRNTIGRVSIASICQREKLVTNDDYNVYTAYQLSLGQLNGQNVDSSKMQQLYMDELRRLQTISFTPKEIDNLRPYCVNVGVVTHRIRQQGTQQQIPVWIPPPTTTTNCMTTYGWTRCTTN